jgi:hypothetical protein
MVQTLNLNKRYLVRPLVFAIFSLCFTLTIQASAATPAAAQPIEFGWTPEQVLEAMKGKYEVYDTVFPPARGLVKYTTINQLRFAPFVFNGVKGLLTVGFDKAGAVNSLSWEKGSVKQRENPFKLDFSGKETMLGDNASESDLEAVAKKLVKQLGAGKKTENKYLKMYEWSDPTKDQYLYLREGRILYHFKPVKVNPFR